MVLPDRLWICRMCRAQFDEAWKLKRHFVLTHDLDENTAWEVTDRSVYFLRVLRVEYPNSTDTEISRGTLKKDGRRRTGKEKGKST